MSKIEDVIRSFGGHQYKICYRDLCCVIAVEMDYQPNPPKMKVIVVEASQRLAEFSVEVCCPRR